MKLLPSFLARRPHIAEHDFAGVIVDSNRTDFKDGDEVFGWVPASRLILTEVDTLVLDHLPQCSQ